MALKKDWSIKEVAMPWISYREGSRTDWGSELASGSTLNREQIQLGAILRIADAVEKMAEQYDQLIRDRDYYKRRYRERGATIDRLKRSNAALRGHLKRKKAACLAAEVKE